MARRPRHPRSGAHAQRRVEPSPARRSCNQHVALAEVPDDSAPVARYRFDGLNRRIRKLTDIVEDEGDSVCTVTEYYYNSTWQVLEERREEEVSLWDTDHFIEPAVAADVYCQYLWSLTYIDSPVLRDRTRTGRPCGSADFVADLQQRLGRVLLPGWARAGITSFRIQPSLT